MVSQHKNSEYQDLATARSASVGDRGIASDGLSSERAGVSLTSADANVAHRAMQLSGSGNERLGGLILTGAEWSPTLDSDIFNDFTIAGKNRYNEWAGRQGAKHNLVEDASKDVTEENAFRHTLTSAIYSMKYGSRATLELGWANEQKDYNIVTSLMGKIDIDKIADSNADLLNNRSGIEIAQRLVREKGEGNVTIKDLEEAVIKDLRAGKLVTHPDQELRSGRLAPEMLSYHRMPGLIQWEAKNGPTESDRARAREILKHRGIKE